MLLLLAVLGCRNKGELPNDTGPVGLDSDPQPLDLDGDGFDETEDCDDQNNAVYPGATEIPYNGQDDDCDPSTPDDDLDGDGYLGAEDCDDTDAMTNPAASETCDGADNDCDGETDENVGELWYADVDKDGYGDPDSSVQSCDGENGTVDNDQDCDDTSALSHPGAEEICDELDNDCDGDTDEDVQSTYWADVDGDGHGDAANTIEACAEPVGYASTDLDCDDSDATVSPNATEICNGVDDDCDGDTDEDDAADAETWWADADSDGYGSAATSMSSCEQPSGYVGNDEDCDDTDASLNPDTVWYLDHDGDGYGDPDFTLESCEQPSGYLDDDTDCDDLDGDVNPDAEEVCNGVDDDCDGDVDTEDSDASEDMDEDGLRNDWDVEPCDASVARGPSAGLGGDGAITLSSDETWEDWTLLDGGATAGDTSVDVDDSSFLSAGDEVLVLSQQGSDAGTWETAFVASISSDTLTLEPALEHDYDSASVVLVQRIPHATDFTLDSGVTLDSSAWEGAGGGVLVLRATGDVDISGTIDLIGAGFRGGDGVTGNGSDPVQGESHAGAGSSGDTSANEGGGGAYPRRGDNGDSGGGGSYGGQGGYGTSYSGSAVCDPGDTYGDAQLADWFLGSGGGGGSPDTESDGSDSGNVTGDGGAGGGLLAIWAGTSLDVSGSLLVDGEDGEDASANAGEIGGGGAGSGGQILLASPDLSLGGTVSAQGGEGGASAWHSGSPYGSAYGGDGGEGRVRLEYDSLDGTSYPSGDTTVTEPDAGSSGAWED